MNRDRRKLLTASASAAACVFFGSKQAIANVDQLNQIIKAFTGGKEPSGDGFELTMPEIAENGHSVPVSVLVDSSMNADDYLDSVMIVAQANPEPQVAVFHFSKHSGEAKVSTRIRLAETQEVVAIAKLSNGDFIRTSRHVEVTVGGCGN